MRKLLILLITLSFVLGGISVTMAQNATPQPTGGDARTLLERTARGDVCAWPVALSVETMNVYYPETNAVYFLSPYILSAGQTLVIEGAFPLARFSSLTTYYGTAAGAAGLEVLGWLPDHAIEAEEGSANPATTIDVSSDIGQRRWTVRVTETGPGDLDLSEIRPSASNTLPAHPEGFEGVLGILVMRIYVPDDPADPTGGVGLPTLRLENASSESRQLGECSAEDASAWSAFIGTRAHQLAESAVPPPLPSDDGSDPEFRRLIFEGLAPNPDAAYLAAPVKWEPGRIVVIRGMAPTAPDTRAGASQAEPSELRYFSFCTGSNIIPYPAAGCIPDFEIPIASDGTYTIVVSQPEDRPETATTENGVAWLQGADPSLPDLIGMRHILPSDDFASQSAWAVSAEATAAEAAAIMGSYYPQARYCDTATFEAGGVDACFGQNPEAEGAAAASPESSPVAAGETIRLEGLFDAPGPLSFEDLEGLPTDTVETTYLDHEGTELRHTYTGVRLWDALLQSGLTVDPELRENSLHKYIILTARDGYVVVLSLGEIDPEFGNHPYLLAWLEDGEPLDTDRAPFMLVPSGDVSEGRFIFGIVSIEVREVERNSGA
ncbi:MAG: hypothetical protein AB7V46_02435 [Thermomicrobiales bacterium]